ncbi:MAG TPA: acyl carrier protein [Bacteroidales bacterium]|nr:acyl carrier protein [Bacteroidales bacterium]
MKTQKFLRNFASQFDEVDPETIKIETRFRDIEGWSSLTALSIIAMADEEYNVKLKGDDIRKAVTVEDLFNIINSK